MITLNIDLTDEIDIDFYFKVLACLAAGDDGQVDQAERDFIQAQADIYSVDSVKYFENVIDWHDIDSDIESPSRETALSIVRDGIALGYINGELSPRQREILYEVAVRLGLKQDAVEKVEGWLKEYWAVLEKGNKILHGY